MGTFDLPKLPYSYDALEPYIDAKTMEIHHSKHHQSYTDGLNNTIDNKLMAKENRKKGIVELLVNLDQIRPELRDAVNFHGGGFYNHDLFWKNMSPDGGGKPEGKVEDEINSSFGNFAKFKKEFSDKTAAIQGSGWGWLVYNPENQKVEFITMPNQTSPITEHLVPLLGLDVWEHAYYLKYQNRRPEYIEAWWNVVNWKEVDFRLSRAETLAGIFSEY